MLSFTSSPRVIVFPGIGLQKYLVYFSFCNQPVNLQIIHPQQIYFQSEKSLSSLYSVIEGWYSLRPGNRNVLFTVLSFQAYCFVCLFLHVEKTEKKYIDYPTRLGPRSCRTLHSHNQILSGKRNRGTYSLQ